jgi:hypothetical protein
MEELDLGGDLNTGRFFVLITGRRPTPRPLYKGRGPPFSTAPLPALLLFPPCPSTTRTERLHRHFFTAIARSPCRHPCPGEARDGLPVHPSFGCATADEPPCLGAVARMSSGEPLRPAMASPLWTGALCGPRMLDRVRRIFPLKNNSASENPHQFCS